MNLDDLLEDENDIEFKYPIVDIIYRTSKDLYTTIINDECLFDLYDDGDELIINNSYMWVNITFYDADAIKDFIDSKFRFNYIKYGMKVSNYLMIDIEDDVMQKFNNKLPRFINYLKYFMINDYDEVNNKHRLIIDGLPPKEHIRYLHTHWFGLEEYKPHSKVLDYFEHYHGDLLNAKDEYEKNYTPLMDFYYRTSKVIDFFYYIKDDVEYFNNLAQDMVNDVNRIFGVDYYKVKDFHNYKDVVRNVIDNPMIDTIRVKSDINVLSTLWDD